MLIFLIVGGVGLAFLVISIFFGEVFDLLDGAFSGTALGAGLTIFGASGTLVVANGLPSWLAYLLAAVIGLASFGAVQLLIRRFKASEDGTPSDPTQLFGVTRTRITPTSGEVSLDGSYEVETRMAFAAEEIPAGTPIRVLAIRGSRVQVERVDATDVSTNPSVPPRTGES